MFGTCKSAHSMCYVTHTIYVQVSNEIEGLYNKIILTRVQSYIKTCLLPLELLLRTHDNTDNRNLL